MKVLGARRSRVWGLALAVAATLTSCSDDPATAPSPSASGSHRGIPAVLLLDGEVEILDVRRTPRVVIARARIDLSVEETLDRYRAVAEAQAADVLFEDYEGFEAEFFMSNEGRITQIRIRARGDGSSMVSIGILPES